MGCARTNFYLLIFFFVWMSDSPHSCWLFQDNDVQESMDQELQTIITETDENFNGTCIDDDAATSPMFVHEARSYAVTVTLPSNLGARYQVLSLLNNFNLHCIQLFYLNVSILLFPMLSFTLSFNLG